jgi:mannan polymerase II complex MNN10 subunit
VASSSSGAHRRRTSSISVHAKPSTTTLLSAPLEESTENRYMSLDRSPSPREGGGWSSPGLTTPYDDVTNARSRGSSPSKKYGELVNGNAGGHVTWASASKASARVHGTPSYKSSNEGYFMRHMRRMSSGLPYFSDRSRYAEKEKLGRGRPWERLDWRDLPRRIALLLSRRRKQVALFVLILLLILLWNSKSEHISRRIFLRYLLTR